MANFSPEALQRFEDMLRRDAKSQVFAPLAEAYREEGRHAEADRLTDRGTKLNPNFAGGWVSRGKLLRDLDRLDEARDAFQKAVRFAPENLSALTQLAETLLELKDPKSALKVFKQILFINPHAEKAKRIVEKLESVTADEFGDELFAMTKLASLDKPKGFKPLAPEPPGTTPKSLIRLLSLIDAFIVRHDLERAQQLLDEAQIEFGDRPELTPRRIMLQRRGRQHLAAEEEIAEPMVPIASREKAIRQRKVDVLHAVLQKLETLQDGPLP